MSDTFNLENLTVEVGKKLVESGSKDVFKHLYEIPASFIENNLQQLITSGYKPTEILQHITRNLYELNDPLNLITKLIDDHKADASKLSYISSDLNINSIEFLLSKGMKGDVFLMPAFQNSDTEKQKELFELAFKHGASSSSFKSVYAALENLNESVFKLLIDTYKVSLQDLLHLVVRASTSQYNQANQKSEPNQELISKQTELANFCVAEGANFKGAFENIYYIPASFIENNLQQLITSGYKPTEVLQHIISNSHGLNDQLSLIKKLISDHKADASKLSYISSDLNMNSIEFLLSKGMKGDVLLITAFQNSDTEKQKELFELAFKHGASSDSFKNLDNISVENLNEGVFEILITNHKVPAQDLLNLVVRERTSQYNQANQKYEPNQELINKHTALTNLLIGSGAKLQDITNFSSDFVKNNLQLIIDNKVKLQAESLDLDSLTIEEFKTLLKHNISPKDLFTKVLRYAEGDDKPLSEESISKLKNLVELARTNNDDANKIFSQYSQVIYSSYNNGHIFTLNSDIFKYLLENKWVDATLALEYAIGHRSVDLANLAFSYQPDINAKTSGSSDLTMLDQALYTGNLDIINWLLDKGVKHDVNYEAYLRAISNTSFNNACKIIARLPEIYSQDKTYECLRAEGSSISLIKSFTDYYNLIVDYVAATHGKTTSLSELEQRILQPDSTIEVGNTGTNITNIYGYTNLHLAIISGKYDLVQKMIEAGHDIYAQNKNGTTPLELIAGSLGGRNANHSERQTLEQLKKLIITKVDNIDILSDNGESLADILMQSQETLDTVLSKTQDPLFHFYKPDNTSSNLDPEKVHIAISNGEGFWSTGAWAVARLLMKEHKDVEFHLVSYDMLKQGGDNFIKQFDAFINPGAADSYPRNLSEFTKKDCQFSMELEQLYQLVLQKTDELKIPYLGICAGAQHFALYHQGTLAPLEGYNSGKHEIEFVKGTTPYFLSLTPEQQWQALKVGIFPQVKFKGDTAHHFAALNGKIGQDMTLGAVSEDQVPMAYAHKNGIRIATQYHPEHHYADTPSTKHEKAWLDNFVVLARLHHNHKVHGTVSPTECLQFVKQQIAQFIPDDTTSSVEAMGKTEETTDL